MIGRRGVMLGLLTASGCASVSPVAVDVETQGMASPEVALRRSRETVGAQMSQLGMLTPPTRVAAPTVEALGPVLPDPLVRTVSFEWDGPLEKGVARLAHSVGYTFFVTAPQRHTPLPVSVRVVNVSAVDAFRALGEAAGSRATVRLVPLHHQVQVIYHA